MTKKTVFVYFLASAVLALAARADVNLCEDLPLGTYKVKFDTPGYEDYNLILRKDSYTMLLKDGKQIDGPVVWISPCVFRLDGVGTENEPDSLTEVSKALESLGKPCIEITGKNKNEVTFWTRHEFNLHITINRGRFIKS